jgi:ABC-type ATPase with predicted acetyltransferase domain
MFGLDRPPPDTRPRVARHAAILESLVGPGEIGAIAGPSGAGKSTALLAAGAAARARGRAVVVVDPDAALPDRPILDLVPGSLEGALRLLARAGLSEVPLFGLRPRQLSAGQRFRLALALAMSEAERSGGLLMIDELGSALDPTTGVCLARLLRRWVRGPVRALCATTRGEILESLGPDLLLDIPLAGEPILARRPTGDAA